jgi:cyclohexadienyl dehydratase
MIRILPCLAAIFLVAASAHAQRASRLDDIIKRGTLRVGLTGDYLPFSSYDKETSKFRGFDVDIAESLGKALGVKVEYVHTAWPQLMKDFESDDFDIAMGGISIDARSTEERNVLHTRHARRQDADRALRRQEQI